VVYQAAGWHFYGFSETKKLKFFTPLGNRREKKEIMRDLKVPILSAPKQEHYQHLSPPDLIVSPGNIRTFKENCREHP
jgi:hypothetical protein